MNWEGLLTEKRVKPHKTSLSEMVQLREIVVRDLADAQIRELSMDRRFACLYSAALQLAHTEIHELQNKVLEFQELVERWIKQTYPHLG